MTAGRRVRLLDQRIGQELDQRIARLEVAASALSAAVGNIRLEVDRLLTRPEPVEEGRDPATAAILNL